jgi:tRNA(Ile)-lysidine synthase
MNLTHDIKTMFRGVDTSGPVLVAVSGGSDSIALLMLASAWAGQNKVDLQVVTVDHGLRPEAAAEAAFVAGVSESLRLSHVTLAWDGIKPLSGVASAARNARYRLIEEFAKDIGATTVLVGHTADDQAETVYMRNQRNSNYAEGRGLSGMARHVKLPDGLNLRRPLLALTRAELRAYLSDLNQSWIEDPSNRDEAFERVRVRKELAGDEDRIRSICRFADVMARDRAVRARSVYEFLDENLTLSEGPTYQVPVEALELLEKPIRTLTIQVLAALAGGGEYFVPPASVSRLFEFSTEARMTMGSAIVERSGSQLRLYREKRNLPGILVAPGEETIWDGRLKITNASSTTYFCGPVDASRLELAEAILGKKLPVRPRAAIGGTPFLNGDGDDLCLPFVKGFELPKDVGLSLCCPAIEHFCPEQEFVFLTLVDELQRKLNVLIQDKL